MNPRHALTMASVFTMALTTAAATVPTAAAQDVPPPRVFLWDANHLSAVKKRSAAGDKTTAAALARLEADAKKAMPRPVV
jgi:hypothetical protein